jgi:hypothetical protein
MVLFDPEEDLDLEEEVLMGAFQKVTDLKVEVRCHINPAVEEDTYKLRKFIK